MSRIASLAFLLLIAVALSFPQQASAAQAQLHTLHSFSGPPDGQGAMATPVVDASGNIFGTTYFGGPAGHGTAFELIANGPGKYIKKNIHNFCSTTCSDGAFPEGGVILDGSGNLYGTANTSNSGGGLVYRLSFDPVGGKWIEKVLYNFCSQPSCVDGQNAKSGLLLDAAGNLYGVTEQGGANGAGVVFELTPNAAHTRYTEKVLYSFCSQPSCADGGYPDHVRLIMDVDGNLYGTTRNGGGASNPGVVFELTPNAQKTVWTETVLHTFCSLTNCADGNVPEAGVVMDSAGNLFGTTSESDHSGLAYELVPNASTGIWTENIIHDFCVKSPCTQGFMPTSELAFNAGGQLIGTALADTPINNSDNGIVFALTPNAGHTGWSFTKLAAFCGAVGCQSFITASGVSIDSSGNIFGTTFNGGKTHLGSVYEFVAP